MDVIRSQEKTKFHYNLNSQLIIIPIIKIFLYFNFFLKLRITPQTKAKIKRTKAKIKHTSKQHKLNNLTTPIAT